MKTSTPTVDILTAAARAAARSGHASADAIYNRVARLIFETCGKKSAEYISCIHELGDFLCENERWHEAEEQYVHALSLHNAVSPPNDSTKTILLRSLADVCKRQGKELDARRYEKESAKALKKLLAGKGFAIS